MLVGAQGLQRRTLTVEGKAKRSHLILDVPAGKTWFPHQGIKMIFPGSGGHRSPGLWTTCGWSRAIDHIQALLGRPHLKGSAEGLVST